MTDSKLARWAIVGTVLLALASIGCSRADRSGRLPISGTVTLKGQPLDRGTIEFSPAGPDTKSMSGATITDGKFAIPAQQGLTPGTYRVRISSSEGGATASATEMPGDSKAAPVAKDRIPPEFNTETKQEIKVTAGGPNTFEFSIP